MHTTFFLSLLILACTIAHAQNGMRLKYRTFTQGNSGMLNTFPVDSVVMIYPDNESILATEDINFGKTQASLPADSNSKTLYSYDQYGNETSTIRLRRTTGNPWEKFYKIERLFDSEGRMVDYIFFRWVNGLWKEINQTVIGYNSAGNEFSRIERDTIAGILTNKNFYGTFYDSLDRKTGYTWQIWENGNWQFYRDDEYYYKGTSTLLDSIIHKYWDVNTSTKKISGRTTFLYNTQGQVTKEIRENLQNNQYVYSSMLEFGYDNAGRKNATVSYNWSSSDNTWIPNSGDYYTFDALGRITESILKQRNNTTLQLENRGKSEYIFTPDSSLITGRAYNWNNNNWEISSQNIWVFESVGATNVLDKEYNLAVNTYPNPFAENTLITFESKQNAEATITLLNTLGEIVLEQKLFTISGNNTFLWNGNNKHQNAVAPGCYFIHIKQGNNTIISRIVKQ